MLRRIVIAALVVWAATAAAAFALGESTPVPPRPGGPGPVGKARVISAARLNGALTALTEANGKLFGAGQGKLAELNGSGQELSSVKIGVTKLAGLAPFKSGQLLAGDAANNAIFSINAQTGATTKLLSLSEIPKADDPGGALSTGGELSSIAFDGTNLYAGVSAGYSSAIYKINPDTKRVVGFAYSPGPDPDAMQFVNGALFVATNKSTELRNFTPGMKLKSGVIRLPEGRGMLLKGNNILRLEVQRSAISQVRGNVTSMTTAPVLAMKPGKITIPAKAIDWAKAAAAILAAQERRYAVLICGDVAESGYNEFWNDTLWMYQTLRNKGYSAESIFVLYGDGAKYNSPNPRYQTAETVVDFPATNGWVDKVFDGLKNGDTANGIPKMDDNDILFVWTFDHGGGNDPSTLGLRDGGMGDTHFAAKLNAVPYGSRAIYMQQCRSGGFINDLRNSKTSIYTACRSFENAHRADAENEKVGGLWYCHGEYNYHVISALSGRNPGGDSVNADANGNGKVSASECAAWNSSHESQPEVPQKDDAGGVGGTFVLQ